MQVLESMLLLDQSYLDQFVKSSFAQSACRMAQYAVSVELIIQITSLSLSLFLISKRLQDYLADEFLSLFLSLVLELYGTQSQKDLAIPRLLSTDPARNWTAGQFMTERPGGSDVSQTETTATPVDPKKVASGDKVRKDSLSQDL